MKTVTLSGDGEAKRNRRSRMGITLVGSGMGDCSWKVFLCKASRLWKQNASATRKSSIFDLTKAEILRLGNKFPRSG